MRIFKEISNVFRMQHHNLVKYYRVYCDDESNASKVIFTSEFFELNLDVGFSFDDKTLEYAANLIKTHIPKKIKEEDLENEVIRDFYKDSKKVNNKKMKIFFNYNLKYPTFKEGLRVIKDNIV